MLRYSVPLVPNNLSWIIISLSDRLMLTAMNSIQDMVDVNTIIGEPIETSNNIVIIPISKVSFGPFLHSTMRYRSLSSI